MGKVLTVMVHCKCCIIHGQKCLSPQTNIIGSLMVGEIKEDIL